MFKLFLIIFLSFNFNLVHAYSVSDLQKIVEVMIFRKNLDSIKAKDESLYLQGLPQFKEIVKGGDAGYARFSLLNSDSKKYRKTILVEAFYSCLNDDECENWFKKQFNSDIQIQPVTHRQCRLFHYPADSPVYHFDRFYKLSAQKNKQKYIIYAYVSATNWAASTMPNGYFKIHFFYRYPKDKIKKFDCH